MVFERSDVDGGLVGSRDGLFVGPQAWCRPYFDGIFGTGFGGFAAIAAAGAHHSGGCLFHSDVPASTQYKDILVRNGWIILLTILLNIYGTLALVGGAIYSAFLFWRKHVLVQRMLGNILIAAGAMMPAMGGSFVRAGLPDFLYLSEFLGVVIMYGGFILATSVRPAEQSVTAAAD